MEQKERKNTHKNQIKRWKNTFINRELFKTIENLNETEQTGE